MKPVSIKDIIENTNGELYYGRPDNIDNVSITSVSSNSKEIEKGALFIPIIGERVDAHKFVNETLKQGAVAALVSKEVDTSGLTDDVYCIIVDDTLRAFQRLAAWYRQKFDIAVVGVTGSVGKTTTKEMISTALGAEKKVLKTIGNRNSQLGVALMMFELEDDYDTAVFEMGISEPGEMKYLTGIAAPECAVVTNIGVSHIAQLGSRENIRTEKLDIVRGFSKKGTLYVCGNDPMLKDTAENMSYFSSEAAKKMEDSSICTFGSDDNCDYKAYDIKTEDTGISFFYKDHPVHLKVFGVHNVHNAISALSLAEHFRIDINAAIKALEEYTPLNMRGEVTEHNGITIIDDTYNASPDSMRSAMEVLWSRDCAGRRFAVLADALELGETSAELHREVGRYIADEYKKGNRTDHLVTVGEMAACIAEEVRKEAGDNIQVISFDNRQDAADHLLKNLKSGDMVVLKGSRGMKMDEIVDILKR